MQADNQTQFFDAIKARSLNGKLNIEELSELLFLQKGAVYKRINGTTPLNYGEIETLAKHYRISLDEVMQPNRYISMFHRFLKKGDANTLDYFDHFASVLKPLAEDKSQSFVYLANELPIFYYFNFDHIFNFSFSLWNHLHWKEGRITIVRDELIDNKIKDYRNQIKNQYYACPVSEIWNPSMLQNLYQQIIFCITLRAFEKKEFIEALVKDIEALISHLQDLTKQQDEESSSTINKPKIYINEFGNYLNIVLYKSQLNKATFIGYDYPHFAMSISDRFYDFSMQWIDKIKRRSVLISGEGYQYRELFFHRLEQDFETFKDRISKLIAVYYD